MLKRFCIWYLRMRNVPVCLNIQLDSDVFVNIPKGKKLYFTKQLNHSGRLYARQED